jgi:hypothetical protein
MGMTASEVEKHIRECIRFWVWSGYNDADAVEEMLPDVLEDGVDAPAMYAAITDEFAEKSRAEADWPQRTDCDRLDAAFVALDADGICAVQYAGYTMSDGFSEVAEALEQRGRKKYHGYCFFHAQDVERAIDGHGLMVAFGDVDGDATKAAEVGRRICAALQDAGLRVLWDNDVKERIQIPDIVWQRRY